MAGAILAIARKYLVIKLPNIHIFPLVIYNFMLSSASSLYIIFNYFSKIMLC